MDQQGNPTPTPRHGRHVATAQGAAASRGRALSQSVPLVGAPDEQDSPRPIGVDPAETGSFRRIGAGEGATVETRDNIGRISADSTASWKRTGYGAGMRLTGASRPQVASREEASRAHRGIFAALALVAVAIAALGMFALRGALMGERGSTVEGVVEQSQTSSAGSIEYRGTTFTLEKRENGKFALMGRSEGSSSPTPYLELAGTPTQLVLYNGAIILPENLEDQGAWDVIAYTIGGGSEASQVVDADGSPVVGQGKIVSVELRDPQLLVTDDAGKVTAVSLA